MTPIPRKVTSRTHDCASRTKPNARSSQSKSTNENTSKN